jgi:hypothetical protein
MKVANLALLIFATSWLGCASQPLSRNQRWAAEIDAGDANSLYRQECLADNYFSPSVASACLAQQPPGADDQAWGRPLLPTRQPEQRCQCYRPYDRRR